MSNQNPEQPQKATKAAAPPPQGPAATQEGQAAKPAPTASPEPFSLKTSEAIDPRSGEEFGSTEHFGGKSGFELLEAEGNAATVPAVNPDRIPVEVTHGVSPDAGGNELLAAAQAKAPNLTQEFVDNFELDDEILAGIANGSVPPPPTNGPIRASDLYLTPGGWQSVPPGQKPEEVGKNAISR